MNETHEITADLPTATKSMAEVYEDLNQTIEAMERENDSVAFDYETQGDDVRSYIYKFRQLRSSIERQRKVLKQYALDYGRKVDAVAKQLTGRVDAMIKLHEQPLLDIKQREEERQRAVQAAFDAMGVLPEITSRRIGSDPTHTSESIASEIEKLVDVVITDEVFGDRIGEATHHRNEILVVLREQHDQMVKHEAEQEELRRLRIEREARLRAERDDQIRREAEQRARHAAEAKAEQEKRSIEAEHQRKLREAEEEQERIEREAQARRQNEAHVEAINVAIEMELIALSGVDMPTARRIIEAISLGKVPNVTINY